VSDFEAVVEIVPDAVEEFVVEGGIATQETKAEKFAVISARGRIPGSYSLAQACEAA
jgi:hypothetical protein